MGRLPGGPVLAPPPVSASLYVVEAEWDLTPLEAALLGAMRELS